MEDIVARIAEYKIREAQESGAFDNLPGAGKPLDLADLSLVPEELRVAYIALKNAGYLPEEAQLRKDVARLEEAIARSEDDAEKAALRKELQNKRLQYAYLTERWTKKPRFARPRRRK